MTRSQVPNDKTFYLIIVIWHLDIFFLLGHCNLVIDHCLFTWSLVLGN
jgi:hypothetical protein